MTGSDVEQRGDAAVEALDADTQALVDSIKGEVDRDSLMLPAIKLSHPLTKEVKEGELDEGVYFNSLTGEVYGEDVPFVVCGIYKGRFYTDEDDRVYTATGPVAPDNWPEEFRGKPFADIPEAEERWKADSNARVHPFGHGPPIATTHNFVGFVLGDENQIPLRLSLMRSSTPAALKIKTMIAYGGAPWDKVFQLRVRRDLKGTKTFLVTEVVRGGKTDASARQEAVKLATQVKRARDTDSLEESGTPDEGGKAKAKPKDTGGLGVS